MTSSVGSNGRFGLCRLPVLAEQDPAAVGTSPKGHPRYGPARQPRWAGMVLRFPASRGGPGPVRSGARAVLPVGQQAAGCGIHDVDETAPGVVRGRPRRVVWDEPAYRVVHVMGEWGGEHPDRGALVGELYLPVRLDLAVRRVVVGVEAAGDGAGQVPGGNALDHGPDRAVGGVAVYQRDALTSGISCGHLACRRVS